MVERKATDHTQQVALPTKLKFTGRQQHCDFTHPFMKLWMRLNLFEQMLLLNMVLCYMLSSLSWVLAAHHLSKCTWSEEPNWKVDC